MEKPKQKASLKISQEVIETIAQVAALEIEGVAELNQEESLKGAISSSIGLKPVEVKIVDGTAEISIALELKFGAKISETCKAVQKNIKENVQTMTGIMVSKVNVSVEGIKLPKSEKETNKKMVD